MSEYADKWAPRDFTGKIIKVGDLVAYPVRRGAGLWLSSARVNLITLRNRGREAEHTIEAQGDRQRVTLLHTSRLLVVEEANE